MIFRRFVLVIITSLVAMSSTSQGKFGPLIKAFKYLFKNQKAVIISSSDHLLSSKILYETVITLNPSDRALLTQDPAYKLYLQRMEEIKRYNSESYLNYESYNPELKRLLGYPDENEVSNNGLELKKKPIKSKYAFKSEPPLPYDVKALELQEELRKKGYDIHADGKFGDETKKVLAEALKDRLPDIGALSHKDALGQGISWKTYIVSNRVKKGSLPKMDFPKFLKFNDHQIILKKQLVFSSQELKQINSFYNKFYSNFERIDQETFNESCFISFCNTTSNQYLCIHYKKPGEEKMVGFLYKVDKSNKEQIAADFESWIQKSNTKRLYIYGDHLFNADKIIREKAAQHNLAVINRNSKMKKTFNQTEISLKKLADKKLESSKVSFLNGIPTSPEEAVFQSFETKHAETLKMLSTDISQIAKTKTGTIISDKQQLINELTEGDKDVLFVVAHCDAENIYFSSSKISIKEIQAMSKRTDRTTARIAILLSCFTADLFEKVPFKNNPQSFSELLIEKNFFDLVIAPPGTINGNDALDMIKITDQYPVLQLNLQFSRFSNRGEMLNVADILELLRKKIFIQNRSKS